ncbi:SPOR domain-containing protein [Commensalibacter nepenthis]|uniref:SPOR domain-containing protein n=1 Tax=Commensalibacter nepenthis TaxID=3043872 RepID=A0ABT6Q8I5_9PROT|nr:SPOR domain-containing protein [Commensalibacter sp. TBRC 10068]MDI2113217.1 SPOR domain-containing protein [Commensalibacter sp. TBRC 10068]
MIDPNSPDPSKRKSFFDEDTLDEGGNIRPPHPEQRVYNDRERMASRYHDDEEEDLGDQEYDRRKSPRLGFMNSFGGGNGGGETTRRLTYAAGGIGALLVVFIGGWMFFKSSNSGIPVFEPPAEVAKVKPANSGNVETIGMGVGENGLNGNVSNGNTPNSQPGLASGPEQANPQALAEQFNHPPAVKPPPVSHHTPTPSVTPKTETENNVAVETTPPKHVVHPKHQQPHRVKENKESKAPESKKAIKKPEAHQSASGSFGLQLASLKSQEAVQKQWQVLKKKVPEVLGKYSPSIQKAEVGGNTVYRLRVKGLASKAQVNSVCGQLKAKGVACTIAY